MIDGLFCVGIPPFVPFVFRTLRETLGRGWWVDRRAGKSMSRHN